MLGHDDTPVAWFSDDGAASARAARTGPCGGGTPRRNARSGYRCVSTATVWKGCTRSGRTGCCRREVGSDSHRAAVGCSHPQADRRTTASAHLLCIQPGPRRVTGSRSRPNRGLSSCLTLTPCGRSGTNQASDVAIFDFSPDGRVVATGGNDGTVRLWDAGTGKPIGEPMKGDASVTTIALQRRRTPARSWLLRLHTAAMGQEQLPACRRPHIFGLRGVRLGVQPRRPQDRVRKRRWHHRSMGCRRATLARCAAFKGHTAGVTSLDFSPDGTRLLSASRDDTLRLWPVPPLSPDASRNRLCAILTHNMSREQWKNSLPPEIGYIKVCPDLPEADYAG